MRLAPAPTLTAAALGVATLCSLAAAPAHAGGVGVLATGGVYQERVYFYDGDGTQYRQPQIIGTAGSGIEVLLGDRDDRIIGITRLFWQAETPEQDPVARTSIEGFDGEGALNAWRDETRHVGVFAVGIQGGLVGQPDKAMLTINGLVGSGFLTNDHTEYLYAELGVGGTVRVTRQIEGYAMVSGHARMRKWVRGGANATAGVRFLFD